MVYKISSGLFHLTLSGHEKVEVLLLSIVFQIKSFKVTSFHQILYDGVLASVRLHNFCSPDSGRQHEKISPRDAQGSAF